MNQRERLTIFPDIPKAVCGTRMGCLGSAWRYSGKQLLETSYVRSQEGHWGTSHLPGACLRGGEKEGRREEEECSSFLTADQELRLVCS